MDILDPKVTWVDGRCYRFFESKCWSGFEGDIKEPYVEDDYEEPEELMDVQGVHDDDFLVSSCGEGKFKHSFPLAEPFYRFIVGPKGVVKRTVEIETKTKIQIPPAKNGKPVKNNNKSTGVVDEIVIMGSSRENIISCRRRIDLLAAACRKKIRPSHFISIPLNNYPNIVKNYDKFKKQVLDDPASKSLGIIEDFFVKDLKLHLTVGVMLLVDDKEQKEAVKCLEKCVEEIVKPILRNKEPLVFKVQGVDVFRDKKYDLKQTKVLFAKVLPNKILQDIVNKIYLFLFERGVIREESGSKNVQLHMSLMKSSRLLDKQDRQSYDLPKFDATKILQDYKQYEFGEAVLDTLVISEMKSGDENDTYKNITEIKLLK